MLPKIFERSELPLSEEELEIRRKKRRLLAIVAGAILILLVAGFFSAHPAVNAVRAWQARRHAQKAFALIDQQKWTDARTEALAAYQLRPTEPQAIRAVARLLSRAGQSDALGFWKQLKSQTPLTPTDLRDEAAIAVKSRELDVAEEAISQLSKQTETTPGDLLLSGELALQRENFARAGALADKVFDAKNASARDRLQATVLLANVLRHQGATDFAPVFNRLVDLARGQDAVALDAMVALAQNFLGSKNPWPNPGGMSLDDLIHRLESHPLGQTPHKLLAVDLKIREQPDKREEIVKDAIAQFKNGNDSALLALAGWLNSHGEYQLELDTISRQRAMQTRELFLQHVDALGALGRWDEIRRLVESEQFPLDPVIEHMYLARCFAQQNQAAGAENNWKRALEAGAGDAGKLITLGDYAEKNGALDVAASAYEAAVAVAPKSRIAQQGRLRAAYAMRDTKKIHAILADLLKIWPNDTAVQNDEAYTRLLLMPTPQPGQRSEIGKKDEVAAIDPDRQEPAQSRDSAIRDPQSTIRNPGSYQPSTASQLKEIEALAEKLVSLEPASLPHRTVLALARLKQNRPYAALEVYRGISVPGSTLTTSIISVHAAVLAATNEKDTADKEIASLPKDKLLPEERALIEKAVP